MSLVATSATVEALPGTRPASAHHVAGQEQGPRARDEHSCWRDGKNPHVWKKPVTSSNVNEVGS
jgi:hypothetical protein